MSPNIFLFRKIIKARLPLLLVLLVLTSVFAYITLSFYEIAYGVRSLSFQVARISAGYIIYESNIIVHGVSGLNIMLDPVLIDNITAMHGVRTVFSKSYLSPKIMKEIEDIQGVKAVTPVYIINLIPSQKAGSIEIPLFCIYGDISQLSRILGPIKLIAGKEPHGLGEIVVSQQAARALNLTVGDNIVVHFSIAEHGNPLRPWTKSIVIPIKLKVVGVFVSPYSATGVMSTFKAYTECQYLLPLLQDNLGRYLAPWGYNVSVGSLWAQYAIIYLDKPDPHLATRVVNSIQALLARYGYEPSRTYSLYYDKPGLTLLNRILLSLNKNIEFLLLVNIVVSIIVPALIYAISVYRDRRSLLLLEVLGVGPRGLLAIYTAVFTCLIALGNLIGAVLYMSTSGWVTRLLLPKDLSQLVSYSLSRNGVYIWVLSDALSLLFVYVLLKYVVYSVKPYEVLRGER